MRMLTNLTVALVVLAGTVACAGETRIRGSGTNPIYQRWVTGYEKLHPGIKIDYLAISSLAGIKDITGKVTDFGGSDAPISKQGMAAIKDPVVHIPTVGGGVALVYNLPGLKGELNLTGPVLAEIFMGKITKWNDAKIAALNPNAALPNTPITPAYRTDASGTSFVFTNYLCTQSDEFKNTIGADRSVKWPAGLGGKGNQGVAAVVEATAGAITYVEANYASANKLPTALMQNKAGKFVRATPASVAAAGEGAMKEMEAMGLTVELLNQLGDETYPIASYTYFIVYQDLGYLKDPAKAKALVEFLWWATHDGQKIAPEMGYAPLSAGVQKKVEDALRLLTLDRVPILPPE